jgi:hypothetical protein
MDIFGLFLVIGVASVTCLSLTLLAIVFGKIHV